MTIDTEDPSACNLVPLQVRPSALPSHRNPHCFSRKRCSRNQHLRRTKQSSPNWRRRPCPGCAWKAGHLHLAPANYTCQSKNVREGTPVRQSNLTTTLTHRQQHPATRSLPFLAALISSRAYTCPRTLFPLDMPPSAAARRPQTPRADALFGAKARIRTPHLCVQVPPPPALPAPSYAARAGPSLGTPSVSLYHKRSSFRGSRFLQSTIRF